MEVISLIMAFIFGGEIMLLVLCIVAMIKEKKPKSKVHFYVARDKDDTLWLYIGKPYRGKHEFEGVVCLNSNNFQDCNLNRNNFDNLKWEDEPVEVFLNIK